MLTKGVVILVYDPESVLSFINYPFWEWVFDMQPGNIAFDQLEIWEVYRQVLDSTSLSSFMKTRFVRHWISKLFILNLESCMKFGLENLLLLSIMEKTRSHWRKRSYREILLTSNAVLAGLTLNLSTSKLTSIVKLVKIFSDKWFYWIYIHVWVDSWLIIAIIN